ncbi:MAG: glycerol-3-phosphate 1-O-acyltransferase PlsY [Planctomycetota bacterium]
MALPQDFAQWYFPAGIVVGAYFLGSVPFGWLLGKLRGIDVRHHGSCNIGATNVGRLLGKPWGLAAFLLDFGKGWLPSAFLAGQLGGAHEPSSTAAVLAGAAAVVGHVFPIYLGFRGGKAVATGCGALVGLDPRIFVVGGIAWLVVLATTRFVSLASMAMAVAFPCAAAWFARSSPYGAEVVWGAAALTGLVLLRHRANIARLVRGEEPKFGARTAPGLDESNSRAENQL